MEMKGIVKAYISLGSNIEPRLANMQDAVNRLHQSDCRVTAVSGVYATEAIGIDGDQPDFLNAVIEVQTDIGAEQLLTRLLQVELVGGRERRYYGSPRTIDLDLILYGQEIINKPPRLVVPHPRACLRAFVLQPLMDIAPEYVFPTGVRAETYLNSPLVQQQRCILQPNDVMTIPSLCCDCTNSIG